MNLLGRRDEKGKLGTNYPVPGSNIGARTCSFLARHANHYRAVEVSL